MSQRASQQTKPPRRKAGKDSKGNEEPPCSVCKKPTPEGSQAMICDVCDSYTHILCESAFPSDLYDAVRNNQGNPLIYICPLCRPQISLKTKICLESKIDDLSKQLGQTNKDIRAYNMSHDVQVRNVDEKLGKLQVKVTDEGLKERLEAMEKKMQDMFQQAVHMAKEQEKMNTLLNDVRKLHQNRGNQGENQGQEQERNRNVNRQDQQLPDTNANREADASHKPNTDHPRDTNQEAKNDRTLIIYNTNVEGNAERIVREMATFHRIPLQEIVKIQQIEKGTYPIQVETKSTYVKWLFLREINQLKFNGIYARPYMTMQQLRTDRQLKERVRELRTANPHKHFIIRKGEIHEEITQRYVKVQVSDGRPKN